MEKPKSLTFVECIRSLNLEELRQLEADLIDRLLQGYDYLESALGNESEITVLCITNSLDRDLFKLSVIRREIEYKFKNLWFDADLPGAEKDFFSHGI